MFGFLKRKSEVDFLREQIKELQLQVLIMANKQIEYANAKMVQVEQPMQSVNPMTGLLESMEALSEQDKIDKKMAEEEQFDILNYGKSTFAK